MSQQANTLNLQQAGQSGGLTYQAPSLSGQIQNQLFTGFGLIKPAYADTPTPDNTLNVSQALNSGGLTVQQPTPTPKPANGMPGSGTNAAGVPDNQPSDPYASIKAGISSAWDDFINQLGDIQNNYLPSQATAQQGIANTALTQDQQTINAQKATSLRDIANTTRNAFQAGNNYLGSMGAGDSSASNQYGFAIQQQAAKQTGDLNNFVSTQLNTLQNAHDTQINGIAQWLAQQQETIKSQIAQGAIGKGNDIATLSTNALNQALSAANAVKQNTQNQYNALLQWAANNASNVGQLQQNIAAIPQSMGSIALTGGNVGAQGSVFAPQTTSTVKRDANGNIIG